MIDPSNILVGSILSFAVSQLKRIPFVKQHPRIVTAVLSTAIPAGLTVYDAATGHNSASYADLATQAATIFTSAIATHETITHAANELG